MKRPGFTIMEMLVGIIIIVLFLFAVYSIFVLSQKTRVQIENSAEIVQNQRAMLDRMTRELRQANNLVTILPNTELLFEDGHGNIGGDPIQYIRYHVTGADLYRELSYYSFASDPSTHVYIDDVDGLGNLPTQSIIEDKIIGEYITVLNFSGSNIITIDITLTKGLQSINLSADVAPRNAN